MTAAFRTVLSLARARHTARHLASVSFCDSCAQVSDSTPRAAERRQHNQLTALTHAR
ncbi:hypothetical protein ACFVOK_38640 [Streptomyces sp. NPDC057798]|uniref:hypothetical protein n=1 Tax=Streptomyces sp. NPDC057798 TaxID=3346252 RepID=UPI0036956A13